MNEAGSPIAENGGRRIPGGDQMERSSVDSGIFWCRSGCPPGGRGGPILRWVPIARWSRRNECSACITRSSHECSARVGVQSPPGNERPPIRSSGGPERRILAEGPSMGSYRVREDAPTPRIGAAQAILAWLDPNPPVQPLPASKPGTPGDGPKAALDRAQSEGPLDGKSLRA